MNLDSVEKKAKGLKVIFGLILALGGAYVVFSYVLPIFNRSANTNQKDTVDYPEGKGQTRSPAAEEGRGRGGGLKRLTQDDIANLLSDDMEPVMGDGGRRFQDMRNPENQRLDSDLGQDNSRGRARGRYPTKREPSVPGKEAYGSQKEKQYPPAFKTYQERNYPVDNKEGDLKTRKNRVDNTLNQLNQMLDQPRDPSSVPERPPVRPQRPKVPDKLDTF